MAFRALRRALACTVFVGTSVLFLSVAASAAETNPSAASEQIGMLPLDYGHLKTWTVSDVSQGENLNDEAGGDFNPDRFFQDSSTNQRWEFTSSDDTFYDMLTKLNRTSPGNITQFAYVGTAPAGYITHGAWIAPMTSEKTPSAVPADFAPSGIRPFATQNLSVKWSDKAHNYVLTDGAQVIAEAGSGDSAASLGVLQNMIQSYSLNAVLEIPSSKGSAITPVGSNGPALVFLKLSAAEPAPSKSCGRGWLHTACWIRKI